MRYKIASWAFLVVMLSATATYGIGLNALEQFHIGDYRGVGGYATGNLAGGSPQNPDVPGFSGAWKNGTTTTSTWKVGATGLDLDATVGELGGRGYYTGHSGARRVYRDLASYAGADTVFLSGLARLDTAPTADGLNVAGFVRDNQDALSDTGFFSSTAAKDVEGLQWGFERNGGSTDLVLRHRYDPNPAPGNQGHLMLTDTLVSGVTVGQTYQLVMKIEANVEPTTTGNDRVSVWIDPGSVGAEATAGAPDFTFVDYSLSGNTNIKRLVMANNLMGSQASHDELRFGSAWGDAVVVSQPVARDDFQSYGAPVNLNPGPLDGGSGWGGAWTPVNNTFVYSVEDPGTPLSYAATGVNHPGENPALKVRGFGQTGVGSERFASRALDAAETGDLFVSFLLRWDGAFQADDFFAMQLMDGSTLAGRFGIKNGVGPSGGDLFADAGTDGGITNPSGLSFDPNVDHLLVARLFKDRGSSQYNSLSVWLDPEFSDYASPDFTDIGGGTLAGSIDGIRLYQRDLENGEFVWVDNLMLGTSWNQVVLMIPEPGTFVIWAVGLLALGLCSWNQRRKRPR